MILDATAGNRTLWEYKNSEHTIFIDVEKKLEIRPTIFASNEHTPFPDNSFNSIFYDPPHNWGGAIHYFSFPNRWERMKVFKDASGTPTYYGWDKFNTRNRLVKHIYNAQKEFQRILKDDGLLWFKWNEMRILLRRLLPAFNDWTVLMTLYVNDPTHTAGKHQTFWLCMQQKKEKDRQRALESFL